MSRFLPELFRFVYRFGMAKGMLLFFKIKWGKQTNIHIPGISFPFTLRKGTSDYETFYQSIVHNQYSFNYPVKAKIVIDGGANIGLASIAFKSIFPGATIVAIEPDKENFIQLNKNLHHYSDIKTINKGLWNKKSIVQVTDKYNIGKWGMVTEEIETETADSIETVTIDEIIESYNIDEIDILKLDIETAEREVFSLGYESWLPKVKIIVIELHDPICKGTAMPFFKAITTTFKNFSFYQLGENTIVVNEEKIKTN